MLHSQFFTVYTLYNVTTFKCPLSPRETINNNFFFIYEILTYILLILYNHKNLLFYYYDFLNHIYMYIHIYYKIGSPL